MWYIIFKNGLTKIETSWKRKYELLPTIRNIKTTTFRKAQGTHDYFFKIFGVLFSNRELVGVCLALGVWCPTFVVICWFTSFTSSLSRVVYYTFHSIWYRCSKSTNHFFSSIDSPQLDMCAEWLTINIMHLSKKKTEH